MILWRLKHFLTLLFLLSLFDSVFCLWWAFGHNDPLLVHDRLCRRFRRLRGPQRNICRKHPEIVQEILRGFVKSLRQCQQQFSKFRWNCTLHKLAIKRVLKQDNREAAYLNSIMAAGITHTVTQACSKGDLPQCSCISQIEKTSYSSSKTLKEVRKKKKKSSNEPFHRHRLNLRHRKKSKDIASIISPTAVPGPTEDANTDVKWEWGGCSDDVWFGYKICRKMLDWRYRRGGGSLTDVSTLVMLHNNEAGRRAVRSNQETVCKCHGLSGSCKFKTCWRKMPSLKHVGSILKDKYLNAIKVISTNDGRGFIPVDKRRKLTKEDLVYLENSPNFCRRNLRQGSLGTANRECNATWHEGVGSCNSLCCGRGYNRHLIKDTENCKCIFDHAKWKVKCEKCQVKKEKTFCK